MTAHFISLLLSAIVAFCEKQMALYSRKDQKSVFQLRIFEFLTKSLILIKMAVYFGAVQAVQYKVIDYVIWETKSTKEMGVEANFVIWLLYEVILFYSNIFGQTLFLFITRITGSKFRTLKEKLVPGFPKDKRYQEDFLFFIKDDIHWFTIVVQQLVLQAYAVYELEKINPNKADLLIIHESFVLVLFKRIMEVYYIRKFQFSDVQFSRKHIIGQAVIGLVITIILGCLAAKFLSENRFFWTSYLVYECVLYFSVQTEIFMKYWRIDTFISIHSFENNIDQDKFKQDDSKSSEVKQPLLQN